MKNFEKRFSTFILSHTSTISSRIKMLNKKSKKVNKKQKAQILN